MRAGGIERVDDLGVAGALDLDGGDAEPSWRVDDDQRHGFMGHLDRVRVAQLVWREAPPHAGDHGGPAQVGAGGRGGP
jgi:hypothetical protein